jgi:hypothetical protein
VVSFSEIHRSQIQRQSGALGEAAQALGQAQALLVIGDCALPIAGQTLETTQVVQYRDHLEMVIQLLADLERAQRECLATLEIALVTADHPQVDQSGDTSLARPLGQQSQPLLDRVQRFTVISHIDMGASGQEIQDCTLLPHVALRQISQLTVQLIQVCW